MISWPMLIGGVAWLAMGVALAWRSADVSQLLRATSRRLYGSSRFGEFAQRGVDAASLRIIGLAFGGVGIVLIVDSFV